MLVLNEAERLPSLHTIRIPENIDGTAAIKYCREKFRIEIGSGLGELSGKVKWHWDNENWERTSKRIQ